MRERAVRRALELAAERFGFGSGAAAPAWVHDRVLALLELHAARYALPLGAAVERMARDPSALEELLAVLRVGETRFYRDAAVWDAIASDLLPAIAPKAAIVALSAGCSTGEEAYTLAMLLAASGRRFQVLGIDRSPEAIDAARAGSYALEAARGLPEEWASRFCEARGPRLEIRAALRETVRFEVRDLVQSVPRGPFHLILFRNVLLYLSPHAGESVGRRLSELLDRAGLLLSASTEVPRLRAAGLAPIRLTNGITAFRAAVRGEGSRRISDTGDPPAGG